MPNNVSHFSINADDVPRARRFYENVFGWSFKSWGPPNFYLIRTGTEEQPGLEGALQQRREIVKGCPIMGYECSLSVSDVDAIAAAVESNGGKVVMKKVTLAGVGQLIFFQDTEGNIAGAMQYDPSAK